MRRILSDQPLRPSQLVALRKLRQHLAKSVRDDFQYKVRFVRVGKTIVARIVEISVSDDPPAVGALPEPKPGPYYSDHENADDWAASLTLGGITPPWPGGAA